MDYSYLGSIMEPELNCVPVPGMYRSRLLFLTDIIWGVGDMTVCKITMHKIKEVVAAVYTVPLLILGS